VKNANPLLYLADSTVSGYFDPLWSLWIARNHPKMTHGTPPCNCSMRPESISLKYSRLSEESILIGVLRDIWHIIIDWRSRVILDLGNVCTN
jgi:hypothetical protein